VKKFAFLFVLTALAGGRVQAATAYEALQVVKQSKGDGILKQLIEVRGETGQPQPQNWTILMKDPTARGGIREFVVTGKEIASERTPIRGNAGAAKLAPLDFARLNLDSDGAFRLANTQSSKAKVGFHTVDYTLRTNDAGGAPLWVLHLFDYMGAPVGTLQVSAENGKVVRALQLDPDSRQQPVVQQRETTTSTSTVKTESDGESSTHFKGGVFGFVERTAKNVGTKAKDVGVNVGTTVKKTTLNVAGTVQEALTGERTVDQEGTKSSPSDD
jgi:hypothetical protein